MTSTNQSVAWLFGRGCSVACGLHWTVPNWFKVFPRKWQIYFIKIFITREMRGIKIGTGPYRDLIDLLSARTKSGWSHQFITTNWDFLLQREIDNLNLSVKPKWLLNSNVFHLNGSIEKWGDSSSRSKILLESDKHLLRNWSLEANKAYNFLIFQKIIVVAGMSFKCSVDREFLHALNSVQDDLPIGDTLWIIVNRNIEELDAIGILLRQNFPQSKIISIQNSFEVWVSQGCMQIKGLEVIS